MLYIKELCYYVTMTIKELCYTIGIKDELIEHLHSTIHRISQQMILCIWDDISHHCCSKQWQGLHTPP